MELDQIQVVIQPQSIIHSMVQYKDGAVIAQLGTPDMKLPSSMHCSIQIGNIWPENVWISGACHRSPSKNRIWRISKDFRWPFAAAKAGGSMPTVF